MVSDMFSHYLAVLKKSKDQDLPSLEPVRKLSSFVKHIRKPLGLWDRAPYLQQYLKNKKCCECAALPIQCFFK